MKPSHFFVLASLAAAPALAQPDWTYDADYTGQEGWASIREAYALCENGARQSPIQIGETTIARLPKLRPQLGTATGVAEYHNYALEVNIRSDHGLALGHRRYRLQGLRFHYPSEHMVGMVYYQGEIRFIYRSRDHDELQLAVFVEIAQPNKAIDAIIKGFDAKQTFKLDLGALFPQDSGYFAYDGSLTYPPCTENVQWRVMKKPVSISPQQQEQLYLIFGRNTRLPQPVYFRTVYETTY